jgi:hypothetical protein
VKRRNFLSRLGLALGGVLGAAFAQKSYLNKDGQAVVCESDAVKCPLGHSTCKVINMPIAIGNDSYQNPDVQQLRDFKVLTCTTCHVLFTRE